MSVRSDQFRLPKDLRQLVAHTFEDSFNEIKGTCGRSIIPHNEDKVVGGIEATPHEFPWQVALYITKDEESSACGGTIIDQDWILTAAHCVDG